MLTILPKSPVKRRKSLHPESKLQSSCVTWFRYAYPQYKNLLFSIPNGGLRTKSNAITLKKEGMLSGVPDLMLAIPRNGFAGMFIEMKFGKGELSENQEDIIRELIISGYYVIVCTSLDDFMREINNYLESEYTLF